MAQVMMLQPPDPELDRILNVSSVIGNRKHAGVVNDPDDVFAVQQLIVMGYRDFAAGEGLALPQTPSVFDAITGYWIFRTQRSAVTSGYGGTIVDGIVSPARDGHIFYGPGGPWVIVSLNLFAKRYAPTEWEALLAQYDVGGSLNMPGGVPHSLHLR